MAWALYFQTASLLMVEVYSYNIAQLGRFISYIAVVYSFVLIVIIRVLGKYFSIETIFLYSCGLLGIGMLIASVNEEFAAWFAVMPIAAGSGLAYLAVITLFSNSVNKNSQGWVMGIVGSIVAASSCFGSIIAGLFTSMSFSVTFIIGSVFAFVALLIVKYRLFPILKINKK
jgi:MFS transporter, DHA1 family, tetracycline resistance protein